MSLDFKIVTFKIILGFCEVILLTGCSSTAINLDRVENFGFAVPDANVSL